MMGIVEYTFFVTAFEQFWGLFLILANLSEVILAELLNGRAVKWHFITYKLNLLFHLSQITFKLAVVISLSLPEPVSFWLLFFSWYA